MMNPLGERTMSEHKTHREVKNPQISAKALADFMAASDRSRRRIVRDCKYHSISRVVQHNEAKAIISNFIRERNPDVGPLREKAQWLRDKIATDDFEGLTNDYNADYVDHFANIYPDVRLPDADILASEKLSPQVLSGVKVTNEIHFRLKRVTRRNQIRVGAGMLRYNKGVVVPSDVGSWQSAFLFGQLSSHAQGGENVPEPKLCLTLDTNTCSIHPAPSDSVSRYKNMAAACATIADMWDKIGPPEKAVF
jgi:hypothetical protein